MRIGKPSCLFGLPLLWLALSVGAAAADEPPNTSPVLPSLTDPLRLPRSDALGAPAWDDWLHPEREPRQIKSQSDGAWGTLTAQTVHADWQPPLLWEDPLRKRAWKTEGNWRSTVLGPFFMFGNLGANSDEPATGMKVVGKTGVACKVPLLGAAEVTVRGGPSVTCSDPLQPDRSAEHSEWFLELQARWPLLAGIGLEYDSLAVPALSPLDKNYLDQDVRFAFPVGSNGKLRLGAKHHWDSTGDTHLGADSTQLYLGFELTR